MSGKISGQVWELEIDHAKQLLLLAYADHADHRGGNIFPSMGLIAWKTNYSVRQVQRLTKELHEDGILVADEEARARGRKGAMRIELSAAPEKEPYQNRDAVAGQQKAMRDRLRDRRAPAEGSPDEDDNMSHPRDIQVSHPRDIQVSPEPSVTSSNRPDEANASRQGPGETVIPLDKYTTDRMYNAYKMAGFPRWTKEEYGYHLGRVQLMLREDDPSDGELDELPQAFINLYTRWNPKADAIDTLREMRRQKVRQLRPVADRPERSVSTAGYRVFS